MRFYIRFLYSQIGIITKDTIAGMELVRSIILQIALCNCYTEVKIGCIYNKNKVIQSQQWDFCRWLPHIWDANRQKRFIAGNEVEASYSMICCRFLKKEKKYLYPVRQKKFCHIIFCLLQKNNFWKEKCFLNIS